MFPLNAIPVAGNTKFQVFYARGTDWQAWQKPVGCSMVYMFALGAGGGGGRPANGATTVGGGGGGSGGVTRVLIPAVLLPDTIYIQIGLGGLGATTASANGSDGTGSFIAVQPDTTTANSIVRAGFGTGGLASTTGGTGAGASPVANNTFGSLGLWYSIAGQAGTNGANAANGAGGDFTPLQSGVITSGGTGGGNGTGRAGNINAGGAFSPLLSGGSGGTGAQGVTGFQKGLPILQGLKTAPLFFTGGIGGGGHSTGTAGRGGDAAYGGGGGGGGGCSNAAGTSGNGGNGGDGFVIIGAF